MYGEKAEEVQELKLDLQDVKEMYRQQVSILFRNDNTNNTAYIAPFPKVAKRSENDRK